MLAHEPVAIYEIRSDLPDTIFRINFGHDFEFFTQGQFKFALQN